MSALAGPVTGQVCLYEAGRPDISANSKRESTSDGPVLHTVIRPSHPNSAAPLGLSLSRTLERLSSCLPEWIHILGRSVHIVFTGDLTRAERRTGGPSLPTRT